MLDVRRRVWHRGDRGNRYRAPIITVSSFPCPIHSYSLPYPTLSPSSLSLVSRRYVKKKKRKKEGKGKISGIDISEFFFCFFPFFFFSKFVSTAERVKRNLAVGSKQGSRARITGNGRLRPRWIDLGPTLTGILKLLESIESIPPPLSPI